MKREESSVEFVRRAMNEIARECETGKEHNFLVAIRQLADALEADREEIEKLQREIARNWNVKSEQSDNFVQ